MSLWKTCGPVLIVAALLQSTSGMAAGPPTQIGVKDRSNAFASIAASGRFAAIAWGATKDGVTGVYASVSRDGGQSFGAPSRVNSATVSANVSGEQPPRVTLIHRASLDPAIIVVWTAKSDTGTRLFSARSDNGGQSFTAAQPVPGTDAPGNRGWESLATSGDGSVVAMWLDHRSLAVAGGTAMNHAEHQHAASGVNKTEGVARAQLSKLFFARLDSRDSARALTGGVCYCCKTSIATDADGGVYAAWRHVYDGNIRDIAFSRSFDGGRSFSAPVRVSEDKWVLDGCPENGPALAVDQQKRVHVVWPTLVPGGSSSTEPALGMFYATSQDGVHFTPRQPLPTEGLPRHAQVAVTAKREIVVVWEEQAPGVRRVVLARGDVNRSGAAQLVRQPIDDAAPATYPVVAVTDGGTVIAWTSGSTGQTVLRTRWMPK